MRKKLTSRFVDTALATGDRDEFNDTEEEGLRLRVAKSGTKTWAFRYRRLSDGNKRLVTIGRYPEKTLADARMAAQELRLAVSKGADPAAGVVERKQAPTFQELAADWLTNYARANRSEKTRRTDTSMLTRYVYPKIGTLKVHDVGRREITAMLNAVKSAEDGRGHNTHEADGSLRRMTHQPNKVFALVRAILRWALEQAIITTDPTMGMKKPDKHEAPRERALSAAEVNTLWHSLDKVPASPALRIAIKLALVTGQRIGEICGMSVAELSLDGPAPVWVMARERTKNREGQRLPLSPFAVALIREALAMQSGAAAWVFPTGTRGAATGGPMDAHAAATALIRGRDALGVAYFRIHDLRRTAATCMAEMGINPASIALVLNHASATKGNITGKVYVKYSFDAEKRDALNKWAERLEKIVAGTDGANVVSLASARVSA